MSNHLNRLSRIWQELKQRNVIRRNAVFAGAAFVVLELVSIVAEPLNLPEWTLRMVIILLSFGFVVSIILSWIYDVNPEGKLERIKSQFEFQEDSKPADSNSWKIASYISFVVIVALILFNIISGRGRSKELSDLERSIAVLPFVNMSDDEEFSYLGDAITEEIIMQLNKIEDFKIRPRTSIMQYKESSKSSPEIGRELKVDYLIAGSAQRFEDKVRIRVQLIQAAADNQIWGDIYQGAWRDIFDIQGNVAKQVAKALETVISPEDLIQLERKPTENIEAYNLYLQGRYLWHSFDKADKDESAELYRQALALDPDFALAHAGLAVIYHQYSEFGYYPAREVIPKAQKAASRTIELDPMIEDALVTLAWTKVTFNNNWKESELGFKEVIQLHPKSSFGHMAYSFLLSYLGRHEEAISENQKAVELDPLDINMRVNLGRKYYYSRDFESAVEEFRSILSIAPDSWYARAYLALSLSQKGSIEEAIKEHEKIEFNPGSHYYLGYLYGIAGDSEKATQILNRYLKLSENQFIPPKNIALVYLGLNKVDEAFEWLNQVVEHNEPGLKDMYVNPVYDPIKADPRFQELLVRMKLPA